MNAASVNKCTVTKLKIAQRMISLARLTLFPFRSLCLSGVIVRFVSMWLHGQPFRLGIVHSGIKLWFVFKGDPKETRQGIDIQLDCTFFPPLLKDNFGWVTTFGWDRNCPWHVKRTHPPTTPLSRDSHTNIKLINTFNIKQIHVSHVQWDITGERHVKIETDLWFWHCLGWGLSCYVWRCGLAGAGFKHSTHS